MENIGLESVMKQYITNNVNGMFTAMPARIERVISLPEQRVDVQLLVDRVRPEGESLKHPIIMNVPVVFPGSKSSQLTFPLIVGDVVLCVFSQRSIQRFKLGAEESHTPLDFAKYSRNDAIAIPGLFPFEQARNNPNKRSLSHDPSDAVLTHNIGTDAECEFRLKASGDIEVNAPGNTVTVNCDNSIVNADTSSTVNTTTATINASGSTTIDSPQTTVTGDMLVQGTFTYTSGMIGSGTAGGATASITGAIDITGNITGQSDFIASGISLVNHVHPENDNGGPTDPPQ